MFANYVSLYPDIPCRMHFTDRYFVDRDIRDGESGRLKTLKTLVMWTDEVNSLPSAKTFSVLSQQLTALLEPYLIDHAYRNWDFIITKNGSGFATKFKLEAIPRQQRS
jgi:hypothetical protein